MKHVLNVVLSGALLLWAGHAHAQPGGVQYEVSVTGSNVFHISGTVGGGGRESLQLDWPAWTPGYATIWNYGQHVSQMKAENEKGEKLQALRLSDNRWVIASRRANSVKFSYDVRAIDTENDLGFAQAYLDSLSGWYNGAALFPEVDGFRDSIQTVSFRLPTGWRIATAMRPLARDAAFQVSTYDELVDSPVQLGHFLRKEFTAAGVPISIVVAGIQNLNMDSLAAPIKKIVDYEFALMGTGDLDRFLFIYHAGLRGAGGLEHLNATTISLKREEFTAKTSWLKVVTAHEFFHVWNAKRIRTERFDRYDYSRPHRSKEVWFAEGITAYYTDLALYRTGLFSKEELYNSLAGILDMYENNRARGKLSWEDISWYIWDEEIRQGLGVWLLPGWMIDLKIRDVSNNRFSLDDVMRFLDAWYGDPGKGYGEGTLGDICTAVAQRDLRTFFDRHISGYDPFPLDSLFGVAGLRWSKTSRQVPDPGCELFWSLQQKVKALGVEDDGPAYRAGIRSGDIIAGINGKTFGSRQELEKFKIGLSIGDTLRLDCLRGGEKVPADVILGSRTLIKSVISEIENPTERQRGILQGILTGEPR